VTGTYNNLSLTNTGGNQTAGGTLTVNNNLTTTSSGALDMATYQLLGSLTTVTNGGTIKTQYVGAAPIPTGLTWGGTIQYNATTGGQTIMAGIYNILTLSNTSGTQTASGDLTVNGTLTTTGGTLNMGTNQLLASLATITNGGTIRTQNTGATPIPADKTWGGTVQFDGGTAQTIPSTGTTSFNSLTLNNASGASIGGNTTITGTLTFTSGKITTGANNLIIGVSGSISGAGTGKYVYGNLRRYIPATLNLSEPFDIGDASNYTPVTIDFVGTPNNTGYLDASTSATAPDSGAMPAGAGLSATKYINRRWVVSNTGVTSFTSYSPTLTFVPGDIQGSANTANLVIRKKDSGTWTATSVGTRTGTTTQCTGLTSFSEFADGEPGGAAPAGTMTATTLLMKGNQTKAINAITITDSGAEITAANDIRILIPSSFVDTTWDTSDTTAVITNPATGVVSTTVSYATTNYANDTLVLNVTTNFAAGESVVVSGLSFVSANPGTNHSAALLWAVDGIPTWSATSSATLNVDTIAPTTTVTINSISADTGVSSSDFITNTASQTISGTLSGGLGSDLLFGSVNGGSSYTDITSMVSGTAITWTGATLNSGTSSIKMKVQDLAGNDGTVATQAYTLDTSAPTTTVTINSISADTGVSSSDFITKTAAQTISATLSTGLVGGEYLYGSVNAGSSYTDITSMVSGTAITWTGVTLNAGTSSIKMKVSDTAGNDGTVATQAYTLDTSAPTTTVTINSISADTGVSSSDFITKTAAQTISGTLSTGLVGGEYLYGSINAGSTYTDITSMVSGTAITWTGATLNAGTSSIKMKVSDTAGNDGTVATQAYTLDTSAPTTTVTINSISADTGVSSSDFITYTAAQTISGTLSTGLVGGEYLFGSVNAGSSYTDITSMVSGTAVTWTGATLNAGTSSIKMKVSDTAGNDGTVATQAYTLDTSAPTTTVTINSISADTGVSSSDFITKTAAQTISGTLSTGLVGGEYLFGSVNAGSSYADITSMVSGTAITWTGVTLNSGTSSIKMKVSDTAGNDGTVATQAYTLDTSAPTTTISGIDISADTGTSNSDFITYTAAQTISGTLSTGLVGGEYLYGSVNAGSSYTDITSMVSGTAVTWTGATLNAGTSSIKMKVSDTAGNDGTVATQAYTLDTSAPTATNTPTAAAGPLINSAEYTAGVAVVVGLGTSGAVSGDTLDLLIGGVAFATIPQTHVLTGPEVIAGTYTFTVPFGADAGAWIDTATPALTAKVTDIAGNLGAASLALNLTIDTTVPTVTINTAAGQADPTTASPINFTAVFSESVSPTFATGDLTLGGTAGATTGTVTEIAPNDGTTYNIAVSGMTSSGTVIASIDAGKATDAAGNPNTASSSTDNQVTYAVPYNISGTTDLADGDTIAVALNGVLQTGYTGLVSSGTWTITGVPIVASDIVTVWNDGAATADETTAVTKQAGVDGNITGMVLNRHVFSIGSSTNQSLTLSDLGLYDNDQDANIMHSANAGVLNVDAKSAYADEKIDILSGDSLTISGTETLNTVALTINGTLTSGGNSTYNVAGNWTNNGTFTISTSTVNLNGTGAQAINGSSAISFNNLVINKSGTATLGKNTSIVGDLTISSGTLDQATFTINRSAPGGTLTIANGGTLKIGDTNTLPSNYSTHSFGSTSTVEYGGTTTTVATPNSSQAYGNLVISGSAVTTTSSFTVVTSLNVSGSFVASHPSGITLANGSSISNTGTLSFHDLTIAAGSVTANNDFTVNGVLTLNTNASATVGNLVMGSNTLTMGGSATTVGAGDVTGIVKRTSFVAGTTYSFGNQYNTVNFENIGTLPTQMSARITIGSAPAWKTDAVQRSVEMIQTGASGSYATLNTRYLDSELNGNTENKLVLWSYITAYGMAFESGRSNYNTTQNWVGISGVDVSLIPSSFGDIIAVLGDSMLTSATWNGSVSTDWMNVNNWTPNGVPSDLADVVIPDASTTPNDPILTLGQVLAVGRLTLNSGAILNSSDSSTMTISGASGAWSNNGGTFNAGTGTVIFTNAAATISGVTDFYNVTIDPGAGVMMGSGGTMRIAGTMTNNGTWRAANLSGTTVEYNGAGQTVLNPNGLTPGYDNLILSGTGGKTMPATTLSILGDFSMSGSATATAGGAINTGGNLTVGAGNTFTMGAYSDTIGGNLENHGTFTATGSTIDIGGNFTSDNTFTATGATISIGGDFTNDNTFTATGSAITFDGTLAQAIGGTNALTFNNLTINNSAGVTLNSAGQTVAGTLTLTSGNITTGANNIYINLTGSVSGGSTGSHVIGNLRKRIPTGSPSKTFEIGDVTNYTPVDIDFNTVSTAGDLTLSTASADCANIGTSTIIPSRTANRCWTTTNSGIVLATYDATFNFVVGDLDIGATPADFIVGKYSLGSWSYPAVGTKTGTSTQATGQASFSDFQLGNPNTAPTATAPGTITQYTDGSGYISFQTTIADVDLNDTKLKVEYSDDGGVTWYDPILISATPGSGTVDMNNANAYQIGTADAIDTSGGGVSLTIVWDTKSASNGNGAITGNPSNIKVRVTPNDSALDGTPQASGNFSVDNQAPTIATVTSNATVPGVLGLGGTIIFTVTPTIAEAGLTLAPTTYNGRAFAPAWATADGGITYTATYTVIAGDDQAVPVQLLGVTATDPAGNTGAPTSGADVAKTIDATAPTIATVTSNATVPGVLGLGGTIIFTVTPTIAETGLTLAPTTYNGRAFAPAWTTADGGITYTATYTVIAGDDQAVPVQLLGVTATDPAGNTGAPTSGTDVAKTIDATAPTIATVTSNATVPGVLGLGGTIIFTVTPTIAETGLTLAPTTYNGRAFAPAWATTDGGITYTATYTVIAGDDQAVPVQLLGVTATDPAGNTGAPTSGADVAKTIDATAPTATNTPTDPVAGPVIDAAEYLAGVAVDVGLGTSGAVAGDTLDLLMNGSAFATIPQTHVLTLGDIGAGTYTFTVPSGADVVNWVDGATPSLTARVTDIAGNPGAESPSLGLTINASFATAPNPIHLTAGATNPVGGFTDVSIPPPGATDASGAVTGWATGTSDRIKFTVTDTAPAISTITINAALYTSGNDYTITAAAPLTIVVTTTEAGKSDAVRTFTVAVTPYATAPTPIHLTVGGVNPVGGVTDVIIPAAGNTDSTGAVTGWIPGSADRIKFTVTDNGGANSTVTINTIGYTSGNDYTITAAAPLTIVVTTTEAGTTVAVRTFTVAVTAAPYATAPTPIDLTVGATNPVGGVTNVIIPAPGNTDSNGAVTGWVTGTNDTIKFSVTDTVPATSTITINAALYTSGNDYTITAAAPLTIVVTTTEAGKVNAVRTFTVTVNGAAYATAPTSIDLQAGITNPVGGVTNVIMPAEGGTDITGAVTGWASVTSDRIKFTVTDTAPATSTIIINTIGYTSGNEYTIPAAAPLTIVVTTTEAGKTNAVRTFTVAVTPYATAPTPIHLTVGGVNPVGGVTDVAIPVAGGTDPTGAVTGWIGGTADTIKFTVTDNGFANSTITINTIGYTSGNDYTITAAAPLTIVVTTTEAATTTAVRTFTVAVTAAPYATAPAPINLTVGGTNPVGGVIDVAIPAPGATDTTGKVTGWVTGTADTIKFTVTDTVPATSTITINTVSYVSGADYTITAAAPLTIVVTTTEAGKVNAIRTFTVSVAAPSSGGHTFIYPTAYSVMINNGAATTSATSVSLNLQAQNAAQVVVSNDLNFYNANWQSFTNPTNLLWELTSGDGTKTVYVIYKSSDGTISPVLSASIELQTGVIVPPVVPPVTPTPPTPPQPQPVDLTIPVNPIVILYELNNYQGGSESFTADNPDLRNTTLGQDFASSIRVIGGAIATLFQHINYQGNSEIFSHDDNNLANNIIGDNVVSSIKIGVGEPVTIKPGDLFKNSEDTVYYYGADGKRHTFPNENTYFTWYNNFDSVKFMTDEQLATISLGSNMTYKPGVRMLKLQTMPDVYAVDNNATLRAVASEAVAQALYGPNWQQYVDDLSDAFFTDYTIGLPINQASDFPADLLPTNLSSATVSQAQCHSGLTFTQNLIKGSSGPQVLELQKLLQCLGYLPANVVANSYFGQATHDAVVKFQQANNLLARGRVGPQTRALLNKFII